MLGWSPIFQVWEGGVVVGFEIEQAKVVMLYNYIYVVVSVQARAFN
jgi:hypothetical protein